jgi:hypothetical protein
MLKQVYYYTTNVKSASILNVTPDVVPAPVSAVYNLPAANVQMTNDQMTNDQIIIINKSNTRSRIRTKLVEVHTQACEASSLVQYKRFLVHLQHLYILCG